MITTTKEPAKETKRVNEQKEPTQRVQHMHLNKMHEHIHKYPFLPTHPPRQKHTHLPLCILHFLWALGTCCPIIGAEEIMTRGSWVCIPPRPADHATHPRHHPLQGRYGQSHAQGEQDHAQVGVCGAWGFPEE